MLDCSLVCGVSDVHADGTALKPQTLANKNETHAVKILNPADYPTDLVQPILNSCGGIKISARHGFFCAAKIQRVINFYF